VEGSTPSERRKTNEQVTILQSFFICNLLKSGVPERGFYQVGFGLTHKNLSLAGKGLPRIKTVAYYALFVSYEEKEKFLTNYFFSQSLMPGLPY
jgi:hypothetical protein